jgi:hypothetical protein
VNHYDLFIRDYLAQHTSVSLEKIGDLNIDEKISSAYLPLQFQYNKKASTTPELINYIAERTGKSKVLIQSDIESYTETMRQLINIGKPYEIEGVGIFRLAQSGEYEFTVYEIPAGKEEQKAIKRQQQKTGLMPSGKRGTNKSALMLLSLVIILGILGVIGWGTYNFFVNGTKEHNLTDTIVTITPHTNDSISSIKDTASKDTTAVVQTDTATYNFIYETTSSAGRANMRTNQLINYRNRAAFDSIETDTGKVYRLYIKMKLYYADTARARDSLERYLQRSIKIVRTN